jgi:hypothetical protein
MGRDFQWRKLIASDYWFSVELGDGLGFKGPFLLKDDSSMI